MIALLLEISIFSVVYKVQSASYGSQHASQPLSDTTFLRTYTRKLKTTGCMRMFYCTYRMTTLLSEMPVFCVRGGCEIRMVSYPSKHASQSLSDKPFLHLQLYLDTCTYMYNLKTSGRFFFRNKFQGGKPMFPEFEGGRWVGVVWS